MISLARKFAVTVLPGVIRPLRVLWNQVVGFVFLVFAIWSGGAAVRGWYAHDGSAESLWKIILSASFALIMGGFAASSFGRARKLARS